MHSVIRTPGASPYSKAREALLRHFGKTPRQLAREIFDTRSLGDKLPSEYLDHILGLLPDPRLLFEVMLLDALPPNARVAALQRSLIRDMAKADAVVLENRAITEASRSSVADVGAVSSVNSVNSVSLLDGDFSCDAPTPLTPTVAAVSSRDRRPLPAKKSSSLCANHARFGQETYKCLLPSSCKMAHVLRPKPPPSSAASGNARAGGRS